MNKNIRLSFVSVINICAYAEIGDIEWFLTLRQNNITSKLSLQNMVKIYMEVL